ncbi:Rieske (2Fe-2S) protein [Noviherbaspirillum galbum]|uniref:Rieske 2Fe-2S domain-containing protein n=1 Tax=Noviherbaspirillum galbum TaxID=2709383 RepID=A0A6B3SQF7_9BURK|nr:Rieske 2Fe-2S domain-containing protein [Noviherbaspirillum galbum]NEX62748.1 Rieske 2Fe-2S domain-containing protein [Noviherbaspirillum galbum]
MKENVAIPICDSAALAEGGKGVRFTVTVGGHPGTGFAVRFDGKVVAYLNRCAHVPIELDWNEGDFFESSGLYLMCSTHGALYLPESGKCAGGPCRGGSLRPVTVFERDGQVYWTPDEVVRAPAPAVDAPPP